MSRCARAYDEDTAREIIDMARGLEGIVRNSSIHAAAVVIADRPLTEIVPLQLADAGVDEHGERQYRTVTQFSMKPIEEIGLLKMDFLGLRNLDVIEDALDIIERSSGERPDMTSLPLDDAETYEMLPGRLRWRLPDGIRGHARSAQEGPARLLRGPGRTQRALPAGALDQIPTYARGKHNPASVDYLDARLRPILASSMGVILYQEQAMQIAKEIAGFSGGKADDLRKAIGKKNRAAMAALKPDFVAGVRASGTAEKVIDFIWLTNERSADYSFNRSHAACYGLIGYRTAWLKANYPAEYMAALISSVMSTKDRVPFFVARCEDMGIEILPPDVNVSDHEFQVVDGNIRFGLDAVKGVGYQAVEAIKRAREDGGPFRSLWDFCERVDARAVNKKAIEALIKCGALGSTGATRRGMLAVLEQAQGAGQRTQQDALIGQASIFDLGGGAGEPAGPPVAHRPPIPSVEFEQHELLAVEKEAIGLFISAHPLKAVREALRAAVDCPLAEVAARPDKAAVTIGGIVTQARKIRTRSGTDMTFATLDDLEGQAELIVFETALESLGRPLEADMIVLVRGRVDHKDGETSVVAQSIELFQPDPEEVERARIAAREAARPKKLHLALNGEHGRSELLSDLKHVLAAFPGTAEVVVELGETRIRLGEGYRVEPSVSLRAELEQLTGAPARLVA